MQLGSQNPFGRIPVDQAVEETVNRDTQTPGGTKVFSLKPNAVHRYYQTAEYRSSYLRQLRETLGLGRRQFTHPDLRQSRVRRDERRDILGGHAAEQLDKSVHQLSTRQYFIRAVGTSRYHARPVEGKEHWPGCVHKFL